LSMPVIYLLDCDDLTKMVNDIADNDADEDKNEA
jgi:hypothetical protein